MLAGVLGWPVRHSRSPAMMGAAFRALGLDWHYLLLPVPVKLFEETVSALPASGFAGVNVTIPHKLAARAVCTELSDAAAAIGAVNALTFRDGAIAGDNTDAAGMLDAIGEPVTGKSALVLGTGGAGRAAAWALREAGAEVAVWNRTPDRAVALAEELGIGHAERPAPAEVVVNATSVGLDPGESEGAVLAALELTGWEPPPLLVDLVYGAASTVLVSWAERGEGRVVDGVEVLVRQGARTVAIWTGREAPLDVMQQAARRG